MARVGVALLAVGGIILVGIGVLVALAVGVPALGLNTNGRNPAAFTVSGLKTAAVFYLVGAAAVVTAARWMRNHGLTNPWPVFAIVVLIAVPYALVVTLRDGWVSVAMVIFGVAAILAPLAIGLRPARA